MSRQREGPAATGPSHNASDHANGSRERGRRSFLRARPRGGALLPSDGWKLLGLVIDSPPSVSPVARHVLLVFLRYADADGYATLKVETIAARTGWGTTRTREAIRELEAVKPAALVERLPYLRPARGGQGANVYRVNLAALGEPQGQRDAEGLSESQGQRHAEGLSVSEPQGQRDAERGKANATRWPERELERNDDDGGHAREDERAELDAILRPLGAPLTASQRALALDALRENADALRDAGSRAQGGRLPVAVFAAMLRDGTWRRCDGKPKLSPDALQERAREYAERHGRHFASARDLAAELRRRFDVEPTDEMLAYAGEGDGA